MPVWERYHGSSDFTTPNSSNRLLLLNEEDTDNFQNADLVIVDGIMTFVTNTDDLCGARLLIAPVGDDPTDENTPSTNHWQHYYTWFFARGPVIHRLRSKRTIPPHHNLWLQTVKFDGSNATHLSFGAQLLLVLKH